MLKKNFQKNKKAFTLVELLVVIAIIGILATLAVVALQQARSRARDSKRIADIKQAQTALELFFNEQGRYPTVDEWNSGTLITSSGEMLMTNLPIAPYPADGSCTSDQNDFYYTPNNDYSSYSLSFCLGKDVSNLSDGPKCATPGGILNQDCSSEGEENGNGNSNSCYPDCSAGYICQNGSCVVDPFVCGQSVTYNGYTYPTVAIGDQCWFKENLRTGKFKNGDSISRISGTWSGTTIPSWISFHDNYSYYPVYDFYSTIESYGYVYSSHAVIDPRGLCPEGWTVASRDDYSNLFSFAGSNVYNLRSCRQTSSPLGGDCDTTEHPRWNSSASYGTDDLGFSLLPGGHKYSTQWPYVGDGFYIWTSTALNGVSLYEISYTGGVFISNSGNVPIDSIYGRYVRCIKKTDLSPKTFPSVTTSAVNNISATRAFSGGTVTDDGGSPISSKGVVWSLNNNPLVGDGVSKFLNNVSSGNSFTSDVFYGLQAGKTYYIRAYAVNEVGIAYGNVLSFTTTDPCSGLNFVSYNAHDYPVVAIGTQCWFKENLKTDKFKNGDAISRVTSSWNGLSYPVWDAYIVSGQEPYGKAYSALAVTDPRGLCPDGWQVASRDDYSNLISEIGLYNAYNLRSCRQMSSPLGGVCATTEHPRWSTSSAYGTDDLGFSLLPGGNRYTGFSNIGDRAYLWTRTKDASETSLYYVQNSGSSNLSVSGLSLINSINGYYVRCVKQ